MSTAPRMKAPSSGYRSGMDDEILPVEDDQHDGVLDRLRDMPVGTLDPNIIGDAGPVDVPPGSDPPDVGIDAPGIDTGAPVD